MRGLERGEDAFAPREERGGGERFFVGGVQILRAARVLQPRVLGADAGIIEARADGVRFLDLDFIAINLPC